MTVRKFLTGANSKKRMLYLSLPVHRMIPEIEHAALNVRYRNQN